MHGADGGAGSATTLPPRSLASIPSHIKSPKTLAIKQQSGKKGKKKQMVRSSFSTSNVSSVFTMRPRCKWMERKKKQEIGDGFPWEKPNGLWMENEHITDTASGTTHICMFIQSKWLLRETWEQRAPIKTAGGIKNCRIRERGKKNTKEMNIRKSSLM